MWTALTILGAVGLLVSEARDWPSGRWIAKPLASLSFVVAGLLAAADSPYAQAVQVALVLSALGDILLIPRGKKSWFLSGIISFLLAHVAFGVAFVLQGVYLMGFVGLALGLSVPGGLIAYALWSRVPDGLKIAVAVYIIAVSSMLALGVACSLQGGNWTIAIAALCFYVSDISVAIDRFVRRSFFNRLWGLPLYYFAQLLFVGTLT